MTDTLIRMFVRESGKPWERAGEDYDLSAFAGAIPAPGDLILSPFAEKHEGESRPDFGDPSRRTIYEVKQRFLRPEQDREGRPRLFVALLCEERSASREEVNLLGA